MEQKITNITKGYKIENINIKGLNIPLERQFFFNNVIANLNAGNIYKLPEHMTVLDILRCETPLKPLLAAFYGYLGLLKELVVYGYDVNCKNNDKDNILLMASHKGHKDIIEYALSQHIHINYRNKLGENCYLFAIDTNIEFLEFLETKGINIYQKSIYGDNLLDYSIDRNRTDILKYLISVKKFNFSNTNDIDILTRGCYYNNIDMVQYLVDIIDKPDIFGCCYWVLIHNNIKIWNILNQKYEINLKDLRKHELTLFQNMTNMFMFINFRPQSKTMKQYNSIQKWSVLNYLEPLTDINNVSSSNINTFMVISSSGNIQLIDYYKNKYDFSLVQRNNDHNDLYTLAICNKSYIVVKYLAIQGLEMDYVNINYLNHKKNRYYYDIYALYYDYANKIKLILDDETEQIIHYIDFNKSGHNNSNTLNDISWYNNFITNTFEYDDIERECVICKEQFCHMDEVLVCNNKHIYHSVCLIASLNNDMVKFSDCMVCFQKNILSSKNLYIWFSKPDIEYLKQCKNQEENDIIKLKTINKFPADPNMIYPITITPEQYKYVIQDLRVYPEQNIEQTNLSSFNLCFTNSYDVKKHIDMQTKNTIKNSSNNEILCKYLPVSLFNIYISLVDTEDNIYNEHSQQNIHILDTNNINNMDNQLLDTIDEDYELENELENELGEELNTFDDDTFLDNMIDYVANNSSLENTNQYQDNTIDICADDKYLDPVIDYDENDNKVINDKSIDGNEPVYGKIMNNSNYDKLNVMLNNLYHKHMMKQMIINKYILTN